MKEKLIELETAILAQEKGFDIETYQLPYMLEGEHKGRRGASVDCKNYVKCCTQSLLQKWLREIHNIQINIGSFHCLGKEKPFSLSIDYTVNDIWTYAEFDETDFETYEQALEYGLQESLKLIVI